MSAPFAPSPKLRIYCDWVRENGNCEISDILYGMKSYVRISPPEGRAVFVPNKSNDEPLSLSEVANLDRRLGVDSPFPKAPEPYS